MRGRSASAAGFLSSPSPTVDLGDPIRECSYYFYGTPGGQLTKEIADVENSSRRSNRTLPHCIPDCQRTNLANLCCDTGTVKSADRNTLTDMRIDLVKAALQLTPDQEKYWPAVESAIRARAEDRKARLAKIAETVGKRADESRVEVFRNRDPIAFLQRRSEALAQRSADLDKLAEAWQPLYKTLSPEQRQRMAALAILVLHDMSDAVERRRAQSEDDDWQGYGRNWRATKQLEVERTSQPGLPTQLRPVMRTDELPKSERIEDRRGRSAASPAAAAALGSARSWSSA